MSAATRLATYGTLAPGEVNHHQLDGLKGTWSKGFVRGKLMDAGWGAEHGCPGMIFSGALDEIEVSIFESEDLRAHWERLDAFEGKEYQRVVIKAKTEAGELEVSIYKVVV